MSTSELHRRSGPSSTARPHAPRSGRHRPRGARRGATRVRVLALVGALITPLGATAHAQCELPRLVAPTPELAWEFGASLALHDGAAVVGNASGLFGATPGYVYEELDGAWLPQDGALAPDTLTTTYGYGVARAGDTVIVAGQHFDDPGVVGYVFERVGGTWTLVDHLLAPATGFQLSEGLRVAMEGDLALVSDTVSAVCWVFARDAGGWQLVQQLTPDASPPIPSFGYSIALRDGLAVVGGTDGSDGVFPGVAWVFELQGAQFVQVAELRPEQGESNDLAAVGNGVALDGHTVVLGARAHDLGSGEERNFGAAFVFERDGDAWTQTQMLSAPDARPFDGFGAAVALHGDTLLVGAPRHGAAGPNAGAVYVFHRDASGPFAFTRKLLDSMPESGANFGAALALDDELALVSAPWARGPDGATAAVRQFRGLTDLTAWDSLPGGVAGAAGAPCLYGDGAPALGAASSARLVSAAPRSAGWFVVGLEALHAPFKGGLFVPAPDALVPRVSDAAGAASLSWTWPATLPAGTRFWIQAWLPDAGAPLGFAASDALVVDAP